MEFPNGSRRTSENRIAMSGRQVLGRLQHAEDTRVSRGVGERHNRNIMRTGRVPRFWRVGTRQHLVWHDALRDPSISEVEAQSRTHEGERGRASVTYSMDVSVS
mmetsp:Transcript_41027/g.108630  ORF Transcript_41027/g.108630 Transcript_41027/m.108630 type:complete len:104 (-) Transcript_41027:170-481(-)